MPTLPVLCTRRRARRDRTAGAAAVEAAIVLPVVLLLFIGIVEFGLIFKDSLAISSGVRAGGRIASAEPLKLSFARDAATQVADTMTSVNTTGTATLYVYDPVKAPTPQSVCNSQNRCVRYLWNATTAHFDAKNSAWDQCAADSTRVGVLLVVEHRGVTSLIPAATRTLSEKAVFAFEPTPTTAACQ